MADRRKRKAERQQLRQGGVISCSDEDEDDQQVAFDSPTNQKRGSGPAIAVEDGEGTASSEMMAS